MMFRQRSLPFILNFFLWLVLCTGCQQAQKQEQAAEPTSAEPTSTDHQYKVIAIKDGDTVELLKDGKPLRVRLQGVDCPEKNQDFGTKARQFTSDLVFGKFVELVVHDTDRYGRTVGEIILPDGRNLNQELVKHGFAWHYKAYSKDQELARLEVEARTAKRGLWDHPSPIAPWDFRKNKRTGSANQNVASEETGSTSKKAASTTASASTKAGKAYLCESKGAKTYHLDKSCRALEQCKSSIGSVSIAMATQQSRTPCKVCAQ